VPWTAVDLGEEDKSGERARDDLQPEYQHDEEKYSDWYELVDKEGNPSSCRIYVTLHTFLIM